MTRSEYADYEARVAEFFSHGLVNLSTREGCDEPYFSWHPCQCCGNTLGGSRYDCGGYNQRTEEFEEYNGICEDCVYYAEYGRLDDKTMDEIENA